MKNTSTILTACLLMALPLKAQWNKTLTGQTTLIDQVSVVNDSVIWIKDENGNKFSITQDGGKTWTTKNFPPGLSSPGTTSSLCAVSNKTAFQILSIDTPTDTRGVYKTTDGGDSWIRQISAFNSPLSFPDQVYFWNEHEGVCIGDGINTGNGILEIYATVNGGDMWYPVPATFMPVIGTVESSINTQGYLRVHGNTVYVMSFTGKIYKSVNKGITWTAINTPTNGFYASFDFKDDNHGIVTSLNNVTHEYAVYTTTDGGKNWNLTYTTTLIDAIKYIPAAGTYLITKYPGLSYTADGLTVTDHPSFSDINLYSIGYTTSGNIFVGGTGYVYSSSNVEGTLTTAAPPVMAEDALILTYSLYSLSGKLLITGDTPGGTKLQSVRQTLNKGIYLIKAKMNTGHYQYLKFIVQ